MKTGCKVTKNHMSKCLNIEGKKRHIIKKPKKPMISLNSIYRKIKNYARESSHHGVKSIHHSGKQ